MNLQPIDSDSDSDCVGAANAIDGSNTTPNDEQLENEVHQRLAQSTNADVCRVGCTVVGGTATLIGWVADERRKTLAERIARLVDGIRDVENRLSVGREGLPYLNAPAALRDPRTPN